MWCRTCSNGSAAVFSRRLQDEWQANEAGSAEWIHAPINRPSTVNRDVRHVRTIQHRTLPVRVPKVLVPAHACRYTQSLGHIRVPARSRSGADAPVKWILLCWIEGATTTAQQDCSRFDRQMQVRAQPQGACSDGRSLHAMNVR